jgi:hypothetical protein
MLDLAAFGAIALADGADIWIRDNVIERNGPSHVDPICGIFALRAESISIENNRIIDNGPLTRATSQAKAGMRGGIVLPRVTAPSMYVPGSIDFRRQRRGYPSLRIHDNVVSVWLGRAIHVIGDGEMSVSRNQLSSHGIVAPLFGVNGFTNKIAEAGLASSTFLTYAVGSTSGANRWSTAGMWNAGKTSAVLGTALLGGVDLLGAATVLIIDLGVSANLIGRSRDGALTMSTYADHLALQKRSPLTGKLLFSSNQVTLDIAGGQEIDALSSVLLMSLDDVGMEDNQIEVLATANPIVIDAIVIAPTARANDNRIDEQVPTLTGSRLSLAVFGVAAHATSNVTTLCLVVLASIAALRVDANNIEIAPCSRPRVVHEPYPPHAYETRLREAPRDLARAQPARPSHRARRTRTVPSPDAARCSLDDHRALAACRLPPGVHRRSSPAVGRARSCRGGTPNRGSRRASRSRTHADEPRGWDSSRPAPR